MKLTSRGRYAIQAMIDLVNNSNGRAVRLQDISDRQGISLFYLQQIFQQLRVANIVHSVRGPGGGYVLVPKTDDITVMDILAAAGESLSFVEAMEAPGLTTTEYQEVEDYVSTFDQTIGNLLTTKLSTLVKDDTTK